MRENTKKFLIIGGDKRQKFLSEALGKKGYCSLLHTEGNLYKEIDNADAIILPIPLTKDGVNINSTSIPISTVCNLVTENQVIFTSMAEKIKSGCKVFDYSVREDLAIKNAVPTAEGLIKTAIEEMTCTLWGSSALVTGFGKTAKAVAKALKNMGASVTVAARRKSDLAYAETLMYNTANINELYKYENNFDLLVNTVPSTVIEEKVLETLNKDCVIIEIASSPYGIDFEAAGNLGIKVIVAGSLPGKTAPKTAGYIICDTICHIIKEEAIWKD